MTTLPSELPCCHRCKHIWIYKKEIELFDRKKIEDIDSGIDQLIRSSFGRNRKEWRKCGPNQSNKLADINNEMKLSVEVYRGQCSICPSCPVQ